MNIIDVIFGSPSVSPEWRRNVLKHRLLAIVEADREANPAYAWERNPGPDEFYPWWDTSWIFSTREGRLRSDLSLMAEGIKKRYRRVRVR